MLPGITNYWLFSLLGLLPQFSLPQQGYKEHQDLQAVPHPLCMSRTVVTKRFHLSHLSEEDKKDGTLQEICSVLGTCLLLRAGYEMRSSGDKA